MKTLSLIFSIFVVGNALSQDCPSAGVSTNPVAPFDPFFLNNVINPVNQSQPFTINPFLNGFDWGEITGADFKTIGIDLCTYWEFDNSIALANPGDPCPLYYPMIGFMSDGMPTQFNYLKQPQDNALITDRDYHWEDGWELLYLGIGYYPNGHPLEQAPSNAPLRRIYLLRCVRTLLRRSVAILRHSIKLTNLTHKL
jgi:hypothetical protein